MKNSIDTIGNGTRDLPARSAVPQPAALPHALVTSVSSLFFRQHKALAMSMKEVGTNWKPYSLLAITL